MTIRVLIPVLFVAFGVLPGVSRATTITFQNAASAANDQIPASYGSNITGDATGFVTTDGTGATPNIALQWLPTAGTTSGSNTYYFWEYHDSTQWSGIGPYVAQLEGRNTAQTNPSGLVRFSVDDGYALQLTSFRLGNAGDQQEADYRWTINVRKVSDGTLAYTAQTGPLGANDTLTFRYQDGPSQGFTGEDGEDYDLEFTPSVAGMYRTAITDFKFSQVTPVPEPSTCGMLGLGIGGLGVARLRRRRRT